MERKMNGETDLELFALLRAIICIFPTQNTILIKATGLQSSFRLLFLPPSPHPPSRIDGYWLLGSRGAKGQ